MPETKDNANKGEVNRVELTFDQKLAGDKWPAYYLSARIEDLKNPDQKQATLGFRDALTRQQIVVNAPVEEWLRVLTELAKKQVK